MTDGRYQTPRPVATAMPPSPPRGCAVQKGHGNAMPKLPADGRIALFLDIDGTLLEVAPTPEAVIVPPGLVATLDRLERSLDGALALVTGRRVADADRLFAPLRLVTAGVHGTEFRATLNGKPSTPVADIPAGFLADLRGGLRDLPGAVIEPKGAGVAVHYRNAPEAAPAIARALGVLVAGAPVPLKLRTGRKVFEIVPAGWSKGTAVEALAALSPFRARHPVFIGDDVGDEPAMRAVERLGGTALRVAGEYFCNGDADFSGPEQVLRWLDSLAGELRTHATPSPTSCGEKQGGANPHVRCSGFPVS